MMGLLDAFFCFLMEVLSYAVISSVLACSRGTQQHESGYKAQLNLCPDLSPSFLFIFSFPFHLYRIVFVWE